MGAIFETEARRAAKKARSVAGRDYMPADAQDALVEMAALLERYAKKEEAARQLAVSRYQQNLRNVQSSYWPPSRPMTHYLHDMPRLSLANQLFSQLWP